MNKCSICNTTLDGEYCKNCGQQSTGKKLDFKSFFGDISSNVFDLDKSIFFNLYAIIRFPKKVVENYWNGYRNYYYNPGKVLFYFITLAGLSTYILDNSLFGLTLSATDKISTQFIFVIFYFPISLLATYLAYFKHKKTIIEIATASLYVISALGISILILQVITTTINSDDTSSLWFLALIILVIVWNSFIYTQKSRWYFYIANIFKEIFFITLIFSLLLLLALFTGGLEVNGDQLTPSVNN